MPSFACYQAALDVAHKGDTRDVDGKPRSVLGMRDCTDLYGAA